MQHNYIYVKLYNLSSTAVSLNQSQLLCELIMSIDGHDQLFNHNI